MKRVVFIGSKQLGLKCLKVLVEHSARELIGIVTYDDRNEGQRSAYSDFLAFAKLKKIPLYTSRNRHESEKYILKLKPTLGLVIGWYWLITSSTLKRVPQGIFGLHNSLLPKYRGGSPLIWSLINGDKHVGASLFKFTEGIDDGPILGQVRVVVGDHDYVGDVLKKLQEQSEVLVRKVYPKLLNENAKQKPQNEKRATFCSPRFPEDGFIDWHSSAHSIFNFIRAQSHPYPGAFAYFRGKKLIIWKALPLNKVFFGVPGQVVYFDSKEAWVACGDSKVIKVQEIEIDGTIFQPNKVLNSLKIRLSQTSNTQV